MATTKPPKNTKSIPQKAANTTRRKALLGKIHIAKAQLGLDDETYRAVLHVVCGVASAADLDEKGLNKVINHFRDHGWEARRSKTAAHNYPGRPNNMDHPERGRLLGKIEALLADSGLPWSYADGIAKNMFARGQEKLVVKVQFLTPDELRKVVAALAYNAKRRGK